jgi:hypothetical protein
MTLLTHVVTGYFDVSAATIGIGAPCLLYENVLKIAVNLLKVIREWKGEIDGAQLHPLAFLRVIHVVLVLVLIPAVIWY